MSNDEKLRLLFIEQGGFDEGQATNVSQGAAAIVGRWPSYVASAIWCIVFVISFATLLMLIIFMALLNEGKIVEKNVFIPKGGYIVSQEIQSEFCSQMIAKRHKKRQDIPENDLKLFDSGNNIFYLVLRPLDKFSSCSVESVIKHCPSKNIFMMFFKKVDNLEYENILKKKYSNFNLLHVDGKKILRGSPFEGSWKGNEKSLFNVALLTVWQFGGTVLSENLLMLNNKILESQSIDCKVDPDLILCPVQCAAYAYDLIGVSLRADKNVTMDWLLDESAKEFCGSEHLMKTGCPGLTRISEDEMCDTPDTSCMFVRTKMWLGESDNTTSWDNIRGHCPATKAYQKALDKKRLLLDKKKNTITPSITSNINSTESNTSPTTVITQPTSSKKKKLMSSNHLTSKSKKSKK